MKKAIYIFLTILAAVLVFSIIVFLFSQNKSKGALQVTSNPNSKVYLDEKFIGETPLCRCNQKDMIYEGNYIIKIIPKTGNYSAFVQKITISPQALTVVDKTFSEAGYDNASVINLTQISDSKDAQIFVSTFPSGVQVFLDNILVGQSPILLRNISESDHELRLAKERYKDKIVRIKTALGFKLNAIIFMGLDFNIATTSASTIFASPSATTNSVNKIIILDTPTGFLRVRENFSVLSSEITQVKPGETYDLLDEKTGWYKIKLTDEKIGWISSQYSKKSN